MKLNVKSKIKTKVYKISKIELTASLTSASFLVILNYFSIIFPILPFPLVLVTFNTLLSSSCSCSSKVAVALYKGALNAGPPCIYCNAHLAVSLEESCSGLTWRHVRYTEQASQLASLSILQN